MGSDGQTTNAFLHQSLPAICSLIASLCIAKLIIITLTLLELVKLSISSKSKIPNDSYLQASLVLSCLLYSPGMATPEVNNFLTCWETRHELF